MTSPGPPPNPFAPPSGDAPPPPAWAPPPPPPAWAPAPPPPAWEAPPPGGWPPPPPAWYGGWAPPKRTSGLAIAALVTGLVGLVPVAVGLALGAVRQVRRRDQKGFGLAVGGLAAATTWMLIAAGVSVLGLSGVFDYGREGDLADLASRQVGACVNTHPVEVTDCASPHDREVYYAAPLPDPRWPGKRDVDSAADDVCYDAFEDYVGVSYDSSEYDYSFYAPSKHEWDAGDHTVVCVILPSGRYLTGSVKGSGS